MALYSGTLLVKLWIYYENTWVLGQLESKFLKTKKDFLFGKFREHFTWLSEHEAGIRHSWEHTHKRNFKNTIYRYKKKAINEAGVDDPRDIQKVVPKNMSSSDWETICSRHMSDPAYQERCKRAKQNRLTEKDGSITKHTGGSISFVEHSRRMAKDGREVSQVELHERTHSREHGKCEYVDNKSKRVREEYERYEQELLSQHESNPTPETSFDPKKWIEIAGGPSKGRAYGFGNTYHYQKLIPSGTSSGVSSTAATSTCVSQEQLKSILEEALKARDDAQRIAEETKTRQEAINKTCEAMLAKFSEMEGSSKGSGTGEVDKDN